MIRVLLADDDLLVRSGLRALLDAEDDITVVGEAADGLLVVRVCNEAATQLDARPGPGGGRGLAGLRERTSAAGGTLTAGPSPSGGFEVCASLPLPGAA